MNTEIPTPDLGEALDFLTAWCTRTGCGHITLTAIGPDNETDSEIRTATFQTAAIEQALQWMARYQAKNWNVYFEVNETKPGCAVKPTKSDMIAAHFRHADIDPLDDRYPYGEERTRLQAMATFLAEDPKFTPTFVLDSGNGIQVLWATGREFLTPEVTARVEAENKAVLAATGAGSGTHNIDRLLRVPGTLNFPDKTKKAKGRGITVARLLHAGSKVYQPGDITGLADHLAKTLAETGLLHGQEAPERESAHDSSHDNRAQTRDRTRSGLAMALGAQIRRDGGSFEDMCRSLRENPATASWYEKKGQRSDLRECRRIWDRVAPPASRDGRPVIINGPGRWHIMAAQAQNALAKSGIPIYQRGLELVRPLVIEVPSADNRMTKSPALAQIQQPNLLEALSAKVAFRRWDARSEAYVEDNPNPKTAEMILGRAGEWPFPYIAGVIATPTMRYDGSLLLEDGYDPQTRLYHFRDPKLDLRSLLKEPTRDDAVASVALLRGDLLAEFPLVDEASVSVSLSGMVTPVVSGAVRRAPLHGFNAPVACSGKTYEVHLCTSISTGRAYCPVSALGRNADEAEKRLVGLLLSGVPVICLDNVTIPLGGEQMCQAVEQPVLKLRRLGASDNVETECRAIFFATGNNLAIYGDMTRRALRATLDPRMERPQLREFEGDPVRRVLADRGKYIAACLNIVRAYQQAGFPNPLPRLLGFEDWSDRVRSALVWAGAADPVGTMEAVRDTDPELDALRTLMAAWREHLDPADTGRESLMVREVIDNANLKGRADEFRFPDLRDALLAVAAEYGHSASISTKRLGWYLKNNADRIVTVGGAQRRFTQERDRREEVSRWKLEAVSRG